MFDGLIDGMLAAAIADSVKETEITEVRMRVGRPLVVMTANSRIVIKTGIGRAAIRVDGTKNFSDSSCRPTSGNPTSKENFGGIKIKESAGWGDAYIVTQKDVDRVLGVASDYSLYSVNDEIVKGFIPYKSARIGVAGEGVGDNGKLVTVKNIAYLVIRIPHQIKNAANGVADKVFCDEVRNTLVISPPGAGKTTMLRELARLASYKYNTLIIDERYEIASSVKGIPLLDVGECDVLSGIPKSAAYENCIRSMAPEIIVTDEIFKKPDAEAIADIVRSGVKVFASLHGANVQSLRQSEIFAPLSGCFDLALVLGKTPRVGSLKEAVFL